MRFHEIQTFSIDDLNLDEANYRFKKAENQKDCIRKIYDSSPANFRNILTSIARDDLGELLLVFRDKLNQNIVLDGNRRTAAIKVLSDPALSPHPAIGKLAEDLRGSTRFDFSAIQAQVSDDRDMILKTVYERHAAGKGVSKIDWNALANAKFRFDHQLSEGQDWKEVALLMELEGADPTATEYVYNPKYSHEVFRRITRAAIERKLVDPTLFLEKEMRLDKRKKQSRLDALALVRTFLSYMAAGHINLSRTGDTYADKKKVEAYLDTFQAPTVADPLPPHSPPAPPPSEPSPPSSSGPTPPTPPREPPTGPRERPTNPQPPTRIAPDPEVTRLLDELGSQKLSNLYYSLTTVSLREHSVLMCIAAWAFWEVLAGNHGCSDGTSFESYFNGKINDWFLDRGVKSSLKQSLTSISADGNCSKHCPIYSSLPAAIGLDNHFRVLKPLLVRVLKDTIKRRAEDPVA